MIRQAEYEAEYERFTSGSDHNRSAHTRALFLNSLEEWSEENLDFDFSSSGSGDHSLRELRRSLAEWLAQRLTDYNPKY